MYCKYLSKSLNGKIRCKLNKTSIYITDCTKCLNFESKVNKGINKVSNKRVFVKKDVYSIVYERDKGRCRLCGNNQIQLHHINGRGKNLTNNIDNCIMLCENCHLEKVHKNQKKYRPILIDIIEKDKYI